MSSNINIAGLVPVEDPSYRYKMPKIQAKIEGRGNGIKTVLLNIIELAGSLKREPPEVTKFFGCELGAQTIYSTETGADRAIVNGAHSELDLQKGLSRYIEFFVLCKNCRLPETHYKIKSGIVSQNCLACGHKGDCDLSHKLTTFILAQHKKAKETKAKAEKAEKKANKKSEEDGATPEEKKAKKDKKDKEKGEKADKAGGVPGEEKEKKKKKKKEAAEGETAGGADGVDDNETESQAADAAIERFKNWFAENSEASNAQILEELRSIQTFSSLRPADRLIIFLGAVLTDKCIKNEEAARYKSVLGALAASPIQQRHLIAAAEWVCGTRYPSLTKFFPVLLKQLYDEDLVEEEVVFDWSSDSVRNDFSADPSMISDDTLDALKSHAKQFVIWLQEAEEEGSDGGEDEGDDDSEDSEDA